ncbi:23845_t:CDS:2, partial [Dentiscutata erythropus]
KEIKATQNQKRGTRWKPIQALQGEPERDLHFYWKNLNLKIKT